MIIHAESEQQKKVISIHICTGTICKNCINFSKSAVFPDRGYCHKHNKPGFTYNDFCSWFKRSVNNDKRTMEQCR